MGKVIDLPSQAHGRVLLNACLVAPPPPSPPVVHPLPGDATDGDARTTAAASASPSAAGGEGEAGAASTFSLETLMRESGLGGASAMYGAEEENEAAGHVADEEDAEAEAAAASFFSAEFVRAFGTLLSGGGNALRGPTPRAASPHRPDLIASSRTTVLSGG